MVDDELCILRVGRKQDVGKGILCKYNVFAAPPKSVSGESAVDMIDHRRIHPSLDFRTIDDFRLCKPHFPGAGDHSFVDYVVPSAAEIPAMDVVHIETELPATLGGFRGMGEGGTIGAVGAIANAVSDALRPLGIEIMELPVTPERLFRLVRDAKARQRGDEEAR